MSIGSRRSAQSKEFDAWWTVLILFQFSSTSSSSQSRQHQLYQTVEQAAASKSSSMSVSCPDYQKEMWNMIIYFEDDKLVIDTSVTGFTLRRTGWQIFALLIVNLVTFCLWGAFREGAVQCCACVPFSRCWGWPDRPCGKSACGTFLWLLDLWYITVMLTIWKSQNHLGDSWNIWNNAGYISGGTK